MFSLKANDGLERSAEQYFKRYNPQNPAKGGAKKSNCRMAMLITLHFYCIFGKSGKITSMMP